MAQASIERFRSITFATSTPRSDLRKVILSQTRTTWETSRSNGSSFWFATENHERYSAVQRMSNVRQLVDTALAISFASTVECPFRAICAKVIMRGALSGIPMSFGNDNFGGYTTDVIARYRVTLLEAAIVSPCRTTMLTCCVEGDKGHLVNEELGRQSFRVRVRGSACSFHMIAFLNTFIQ